MVNIANEGIEIFLGILALAIILMLMFKIKYWEDKYTELYDTSATDKTDLQRKLKDQKISYENKIDKLEEVINNLKIK